MKATLRKLGLAAATGLALVPAWVWACPNCASRDAANGSSAATLYFLFAMMFLPFGIAAAVVKVIQRLSDEPSASLSTEMK